MPILKLGAFELAILVQSRIPEDVAVAGFNGTSRDHAVRTSLTTQDVDRREIGRCAAKLIVDREALQNPVDLVPDKLVVGMTT